jgi:hypothetical protein
MNASKLPLERTLPKLNADFPRLIAAFTRPANQSQIITLY